MQSLYSQGHEEGYKAQQDGCYRNDNPYSEEDQFDLYQGWDEGYSDALWDEINA